MNAITNAKLKEKSIMRGEIEYKYRRWLRKVNTGTNTEASVIPGSVP